TASVTTSTVNYANTALTQTLFSSAAISAVDTGQTITGLKFTVAGLDGTTNERITVDGTEFSLTNATSGTTTANSVGYRVDVTGSTATVTLTRIVGLSAAEAKTLVEGLAYRYATSNGMTGDHVVTLTEITDSGSNNNVTTLALASTVHDNTAPTLSATAPSTTVTTIAGTGGDSAGETIVLTVTFDGNVQGLTSGNNSTIFKVGSTVVSATWAGTAGTSTRTLTYTIPAGANGTATIDEAALKDALVAGIKDLAGNAFTYSGSIANIDSTPLPTIDTTAPTLTISRGTTTGVSSTGATNLDSVDFFVEFSEGMTLSTLNATDFVVMLGGAQVTSNVTIGAPTLVSGNKYKVNVSGAAITSGTG
ncbi:hypothetical protein B9Z45_16600, partial [Limnohabitans sp. 2KL-17]|uniref:hypothetical protein n=1 Tax=Limnohabitans sp. 2KL-17 TaxID=1100704 RepID=UPI000DD2A78A